MSSYGQFMLMVAPDEFFVAVADPDCLLGDALRFRMGPGGDAVELPSFNGDLVYLLTTGDGQVALARHFHRSVVLEAWEPGAQGQHVSLTSNRVNLVSTFTTPTPENPIIWGPDLVLVASALMAGAVRKEAHLLRALGTGRGTFRAFAKLPPGYAKKTERELAARAVQHWVEAEQNRGASANAIRMMFGLTLGTLDGAVVDELTRLVEVVLHPTSKTRMVSSKPTRWLLG